MTRRVPNARHYRHRPGCVSSTNYRKLSGNQTGTTTSTFSYDRNNPVTQVSVTGQAARVLSYTTDSVGQIMARRGP